MWCTCTTCVFGSVTGESIYNAAAICGKIMTLFPVSGNIDKDQRTFRFNRDTLIELDRMAKETGVSANQLAEDCLVEGFIHIVLKRDIQAMTLGREDIMSILELIKSIEQIKRLGERLGSSVPERLYALHNVEPSWKAVLSALDQVYGKTCGWFKFKHYSNQDRTTGKEVHRLIFTHDAGIKWTAFLERYMTSTLNRLLKVEPKIVIATDKMLKLTA